MAEQEQKPTVRKETEEERLARATECMDRIEALLKDYNCEFTISLLISDRGVQQGNVKVIPSKLPVMVKEEK